MTALSKQDVNASLLDLRTRKALLDMIEVATVAAAGSSEADAASLTGSTNVVTSSDGAKGVILPRGKRDTSVRVINSVAGSALLVYPDTGGQINALTATTGAFTVPGSNEATFVCDADLHWYVAGGGAEALDNLTMANPIVYDHNTTISANAAGNQASATALTGEFNNVTTVGGAGYSVKLPTAAAGLSITVKNSGANSLAVFPFSGDSINALAVDLSVNIPVSGQVTFRAISATVWETQEVLVLSAPTTETGELVVKASDNAADYAVTLTNASHGQASTITFGDSGLATSYVPQSTAHISAVEMDVLDNATQGAGVASKAVVLDSGGNFAMPNAGLFKLSADPLALAGTDATNAAALVDQINILTGADGVKGAVLPAAADLLEYTVINDSPTYAAKIYPFSGGDDVINELASDEAFILGPGRSVTFKAISATQWYADKDAANPTKETHFEVFDDFLAAALDATNNWITFKGTTGTTQVATTVTAPEGQVTMINGAANDAQDKTVLSTILLAKGSLISLGKTVFETRVSFSAITGCSWGFGLGDALAADTEVANYTVDSGVVADAGAITNAISFVFDTDATTGQWQACSTNGGTVGNAAAEEPLTDLPSVNTYQTLRIEVDASGDARFYINGVLRATRATAVATTALLIPYIWGDSAVDAQTSCTVAIDYIKFQGARPASNA